MEKLIPNVEMEMEMIANRLVVLQLENPNYDINGMFASIRSKINNQILELGKWQIKSIDKAQSNSQKEKIIFSNIVPPKGVYYD